MVNICPRKLHPLTLTVYVAILELGGLNPPPFTPTPHIGVVKETNMDDPLLYMCRALGYYIALGNDLRGRISAILKI